MFMERVDGNGLRPGQLLFARSLPVLVSTMIAEILETANDAQSEGFFRAIGARLSRALDLDGIEDAGDLIDEINQLWRALGWGEARLEFDDEGIDIFHQDLPGSLDAGENDDWAQVAPYILLGAYESWFRSLGSGPHLSTRLLRQSPDLTQLRHGF